MIQQVVVALCELGQQLDKRPRVVFSLKLASEKESESEWKRELAKGNADFGEGETMMLSSWNKLCFIQSRYYYQSRMIMTALLIARNTNQTTIYVP